MRSNEMRMGYILVNMTSRIIDQSGICKITVQILIVTA